MAPLDVIGPVMVLSAQRAHVPVCVLLDHGETLDYVAKARVVQEMEKDILARAISEVFSS